MRDALGERWPAAFPTGAHEQIVTAPDGSGASHLAVQFSGQNPNGVSAFRLPAISVTDLSEGRPSVSYRCDTGHRSATSRYCCRQMSVSPPAAPTRSVTLGSHQLCIPTRASWSRPSPVAWAWHLPAWRTLGAAGRGVLGPMRAWVGAHAAVASRCSPLRSRRARVSNVRGPRRSFHWPRPSITAGRSLGPWRDCRVTVRKTVSHLT
jgi:hypothetical protein